jgi:Cof subfamily protein (haloacid dehalogenase superfamily)
MAAAVPKYRMLAMDLDGTLAVGRNQVTPKTRQALVRASEAGIELVIATGRRYGSARGVAEALASPLPILCLCGTLLKERNGETLFAETLAAQTVVNVASVFAEHGLASVAYRDAHALGGAEILFEQRVEWNAVTRRYYERTSSQVEACPSLADEPRDDLLLLSSFAPREPLEAAQAALHERHPGELDIHVMPTPGMRDFYMEVVRSDQSKWAGLLRLAAQRGIAPDEICAVGDELNDLPMVRGAGLGVAMGNATPALKTAADWICGPNDQDGIADVVERLLRD